jgi:hypothetical protein
MAEGSSFNPTTCKKLATALTKLQGHKMKFETGKTYTTRLITNNDSIISFYVIKRTEKTVTVTGDFMDTNAAERQTPHTMRLKLWQEVETFKPWGTYSMCPIVSADRKL